MDDQSTTTGDNPKVVRADSDSFFKNPTVITGLRTLNNGVFIGRLKGTGKLPERPVTAWVFLIVAAGIVGIISPVMLIDWSLGLLMLVLVPLVIFPICGLMTRREMKGIERAWNQFHLLHPNHRQFACLHADDLSELELLGDVSFEPVIVSVEHLAPRLRYFYLIGIPSSTLASFAMQAVLPFHWTYFASLLILPVAGVCFWFWPRLKPTFYRIVPGRMDIMRLKPFSRDGDGVILRQWNLREAWIECFDGLVTIKPSQSSDEVHRINARHLSEPRQFVHALFHGAISTHRVPELPRDRLCNG